MLDLETLRITWWLLLGVLFMGFAIMDGFDLGAAILLPFVTRDETERRLVLNTIGPIWEGNQVWIILGAGALFAAWPYVYAVAFSGAYFGVLLLLLTMGISRPVSFKYRNKLPSYFWRRFWDWIVFIGGLCPAFVFGILVGNVMIGLPFYFDQDLRIFYSGTFLDLFSPFALWCGMTSIMMLTMHGGVFLALKTNDPIRQRAVKSARIAAIFLILFFAGGGVWISQKVTGYLVLSGFDHYGYSNPLHKEIIPEVGGWMRNYTYYPLMRWVPFFGFLGAILAFIFVNRKPVRAFIASSVSIIGIIGTVGMSLFPFILPSSTNLGAGLLIWDASSSQLTLTVMLFAVILFLPLILFYTAWVYRVLRGTTPSEAIGDKSVY